MTVCPANIFSIAIILSTSTVFAELPSSWNLTKDEKQNAPFGPPTAQNNEVASNPRSERLALISFHASMTALVPNRSAGLNGHAGFSIKMLR
jgi:hypothetical protein